MKSRPRAFALVLVWSVSLFLLVVVPGTNAWATPSTYKDVCTSGCTYSSVQAAIDAITDSSATKVYTVFIDSGVLSLDTSTTTNGKSYINFVGRGEGVSIVQASATWFANAFGGSTLSDFFDLSSSTHITLSGLTIDARTNDPGTYNPAMIAFGGVKLTNCDRILFDSAEIKGVYFGVWEAAGTTGNLIEMFNSKILATSATVATKSTTWHIYSSEIKALQTGAESTVDQTVALELLNTIHSTIWGSHIHAETSKSGASGVVAAVRTAAVNAGSDLAIIGTQLHLKISTATIGSASRAMHAFYYQSATTGPSHFDFVGSYLNYESPASMSQGRIGGIGYNPASSGNTLNFVGGGIFDVGGSGGTFRADVIQDSSIGTAPTFNIAGSKVGAAVAAAGTLPSGLGKGYSTLNMERGSVTLSGGTTSVTLPTTLPDNAYSVAVTTGVNETIRVTGKSTTGFTVTSSNGSSSAAVDWIVVR